MTADFSCPCGTTAKTAPEATPAETETFDATVRRHFAGDHS